jgi:hypothetical protein
MTKTSMVIPNPAGVSRESSGCRESYDFPELFNRRNTGNRIRFLLRTERAPNDRCSFFSTFKKVKTGCRKYLPVEIVSTGYSIQ